MAHDEKKTKPPAHEPRVCGGRACRYCQRADDRKPFLQPRPLTPDDLTWQFGESESALGIRSTLGAFVDMALSGVQSGGRTNGVESRAVEERRLDATARHRCIRARLGHLTPTQLGILQAAFGPDDWTRSIEDLQVRNPVRQAFGTLANVVLLTPSTLGYAARRQIKSSFRAPERTPLLRRIVGAAAAAARLFAADPVLAGGARGAAIAAACAEDRTLARKIFLEAVMLVREVSAAAGVQEPQQSRRVRGIVLVPAARRQRVVQAVEDIESLVPRSASEALADG